MSDTESHNVNPQQTIPPTAQPQQAAPGPSHAPRFVKLRIALGILPEPDGRPSYIWLERWDALIVSIVIAIGVPLLGYSGFTSETKWIIACVWAMIWSPFFFYFEGRELVGQMMGRGAIKQEQLSEQQNTAQDPFFGVTFAFVIWLVALAVHVAVQKWPSETTVEFVSRLFSAIYDGLWTTPVPYGVVEWLILIQALLVTKYTNYITYNTGITFSKAAPMGERTERRERR
jgi:hypothetical protein